MRQSFGEAFSTVVTVIFFQAAGAHSPSSSAFSGFSGFFPERGTSGFQLRFALE
jgi:hypothetical protein